ncbi:MAG: GTP-binding protein [Lachnospiraceae bacterium]|nr:GTP-binding protein [Lachnospiraceae bacterium]
MTKIDIVSGFLGAGKTTLIKKLLGEALKDTKVVLIENEFGEIGIDGGFLKDAGIEIKEMNSGCICCSLVGDFGTSLQEVLSKYAPERILIEPSGVGKLSDVMKAVEGATKNSEVQLNSAVAVVDASKCKMYIKNFGEFFVNQIEHAGTIILSRTDKMTDEKIKVCVEMIREHNAHAMIITTPWTQLEGMKILENIEGAKDLEAELMKQVVAEHEEHEHHHHHEHGDDCTCGCHDHDEHHHHEHHHADDVFTSWGLETPATYTKEEIITILEKIEDDKAYGFVLRSKGMVPAADGTWIYFDYVPGESEVRTGQPDVTGKICVIGSKLQEEHLKTLFQK